MCTVTFLPRGDGGYLLTANRDERLTRGVAAPPSRWQLGTRRLLAPRDADQGGTWICVTDPGDSFCVLNGEPDQGASADAPSRGLLVVALAEASVAGEDPWSWLVRRNEQGRLHEKPFYLLLARRGSNDVAARLQRFEWDGRSLTRGLILGAHVETSSGWDPEGVFAVRRREFRDLLTAEERLGPVSALPAERIREWHRSHGGRAGDAYSVCMHRPEAHTVSLTQIDVTVEHVRMVYQPGQPCERQPEEVHSLLPVTLR